MKKTLKKTFILLLAAVFALSLPINTFATTFSGGYASINYIANVSGSYSNIHTTISVDTSASLKLDTRPYYGVVVNGIIYPRGHIDATATIVKPSTYLNGSYNYSDLSGVPSGGVFWKCFYNDAINSHYVVVDAIETF